jgi:O-antigen/teichoic acid export membrane protein
MGGALTQGGVFFTSVVLARILGKHDFGRFAMIQSTVLTFSAVASLGLGITATKYVSQYRTTQPDKASRIMGLSFLVAIAAALGFCSVLLALPEMIATGGLSAADLRLGAIYVFFTTVNGYQMGALAGMEAFRQLASISMVYGPVTVAIHAAFAWKFGLRGAVIAQGTGALLLWLLCERALLAEGRRQRIVASYRGAWHERGVLMRFSLPATVSGIAGSIAIWWCNAQLVKMAGYTALGLFTAANTMRLMVLFLPTMNTRATSPLLNNLLASGNVPSYRRTYWKAVASNAGIALVFAAGLCLAGPLLPHVFGRQYVAPPLLVLLLLSASVMEAIATTLYQALFAGRSLWWQVAIISVWIAILIAVSQVMVPGSSAAGLASGYLAAWSVTAILYAMLAPPRKGKPYCA